MLHNLLKDKEIILASKSPRRKKLFDQIGLKFKQIPSNIAEHHLNIPADEFATYYAREKVKEIAKTNLESFIVGGDTIVFLDDKILGKPKNKREAAKFLGSREPTGHKGTFGKILVVGGSKNMPGAPALVGEAALKSGAGLVKTALPDIFDPKGLNYKKEIIYDFLKSDGKQITKKAFENINQLTLNL